MNYKGIKGQLNAPNFSIKSIWGIAKSEELNLDKEALYSIIYRITGKESMKLLTQNEVNKICKELLILKDGTNSNHKKQKRTDKGGNAQTVEQRKKIYNLTQELGWNNNNARINGFVKKMFRVQRLEWLNESQCSKLIEMLKQMVDREQLKN